MHIAYIGRVTLAALAELGWDRPFPEANWGFPLGSEIVRGLIHRGHRLSVITSDHRFNTTEVFHSHGCDLFIVPEDGGFKRNLTFFKREVATMACLVRELRPDVVFAQWTYQNARAGIESGYPTLVVAHDSPWRVLCMFRNLSTFIRALYATVFVVPKIKHLTAVSPYIVEEFKKFRCLRNLDISAIPNGIGMLRNPPSLKLWRTNESGGTREHPPTIVSISQAGRLKNSQALFRAWDILKTKHPNWVLKVYGQGMPNGQVSRDELDRGLREEADLFVSPSLEESFGMVFIEAMRFGVPCIGGERSGAVPWVIGDGGVVCDVTNPKKLADCIEKVMTDNELRMRLGEEGKKRVREAFDIEKVVDMYEAELMKVAGC